MSGGQQGGSQAVTTNQPPAQFLDAYGKLVQNAEGVAAQPLQQYAGPTVAGLTPDQQSAMDAVRNSQGIADPFINAASSNFGAATAPLWSGVQQYSPSSIDQYQSPYTDSVVKSTLADLGELNAQQQQQVKGNAISAGAWGGDRAGVAQGIVAAQQARAEAPILAGLRDTGFKNAQAEFNQQQGAELGADTTNANLNLQTGFGLGNLGSLAQSADLSGISALLQSGALQQQQKQQQLNVPIQNFQAAQAYPFQTTDWLSKIIGSFNPGSTSTQSTTSNPSDLSTLTGLGELGLGAAGLFLNRGGRVARKGGGGIVGYEGGGRIIGFHKAPNGTLIPILGRQPRSGGVAADLSEDFTAPPTSSLPFTTVPNPNYLPTPPTGIATPGIPERGGVATSYDGSGPGTTNGAPLEPGYSRLSFGQSISEMMNGLGLTKGISPLEGQRLDASTQDGAARPGVNLSPSQVADIVEGRAYSPSLDAYGYGANDTSGGYTAAEAASQAESAANVGGMSDYGSGDSGGYGGGDGVYRRGGIVRRDTGGDVLGIAGWRKGGGIAGRARGGEWDDDEEVSGPEPYADSLDIDDDSEPLQTGGIGYSENAPDFATPVDVAPARPSSIPPAARAIESAYKPSEIKDRASKVRETAVPLSLVRAGLATLGGKGTGVANIAHGGLEGIESYTSARDKADKLEQEQETAKDAGSYRKVTLDQQARRLSDAADEARTRIMQQDKTLGETSRHNKAVEGLTEAQRRNQADYQRGRLGYDERRAAAAERTANKGYWEPVRTLTKADGSPLTDENGVPQAIWMNRSTNETTQRAAPEEGTYSKTGKQGVTMELANQLIADGAAKDVAEALRIIRDPAGKGGRTLDVARERIAQQAAKADPDYEKDPMGTIMRYRRFYGSTGTPAAAAPPSGSAPPSGALDFSKLWSRQPNSAPVAPGP